MGGRFEKEWRILIVPHLFFIIPEVVSMCIFNSLFSMTVTYWEGKIVELF